MGLNPGTVSQWYRDPLFMEELKRKAQKIVETTEQICKIMSQSAMETIINLMENTDSQSIRLKCAQDILDRAGIAKKQKMSSDEMDIGVLISNAYMKNHPLTTDNNE
jgi:hypothetical protein